MKWHNRFVYCILYSCIGGSAWSQCDKSEGVYKRELLSFDYFVEFNNLILVDSDLQQNYILYFDTTNTLINQKIIQVDEGIQLIYMYHPNGKTDIYVFDANKKINYNLVHLENERGASYWITDHFVAISENDSLFIFDTDDFRIHRYQLGWIYMAGQDDEAIYFYLQLKHKINGVKYFSGTLCRYDTTGFSIISPQLKKHHTESYPLTFYNNQYTFSYELQYQEQNDCQTIYHYITYLYFKSQLVDSSMYESPEPVQFFADWENGFLNVDYKYEVKRYYNGNMVLKYNELDSLRAAFNGPGGYFDYLANGRYFVTIEQISLNDTTGLISSVPIKTINGVDLKENAGFTYPLVKIFDKSTYRFIGYPQVILTAAQE